VNCALTRCVGGDLRVDKHTHAVMTPSDKQCDYIPCSPSSLGSALAHHTRTWLLQEDHF